MTAAAAGIGTYCTPSGGVDQVILGAVAGARSSVRIASFSFDWPELGRVLAEKRRQGVDVWVICDGAKGDTEVAGLEDMSGAETGPGLFHAKFAVVDDRTVIVGSLNFTRASLVLNHNNFLIVENPDLAGFLGRVFDARRAGKDPVSVSMTPELEVFVSRGGAAGGRLKELLEGARESIRFIQYRFTDADIASVLCRKRREGVAVAGILDPSGLYPSSVFELLSHAGCRVRQAAMAGLLHDKSFIIDGQVVVTGSYNVSASARRNTECLVVVRDPEVARQFRAMWRHLWWWKSLPRGAW